MLGRLRIVLVFLVLFLAEAQSFAASMLFIYKDPISDGDTRNAYSRNVLIAALKRTTREFGGFEMRPADPMNESREIYEMVNEATLVNTIALPSSKELAKKLYPVRIPIDRGLLGFRIFLIRTEDQERFDAIKTVADLKSIRIGQGANWVDCRILEDAGMQVVRGSSFDGLFKMLASDRFDAFSRGVYEVTAEFDARHASVPDLAIEKKLLLYYPLPSYFWFPKTPDGMLRARRVEKGLSAMVADGTLQKMFLKEYGSQLKKLDLKHRRLLRIDNSQLDPEEPLGNAALWYDPIGRDLE